MLRSLYTAATGMNAQQVKMDVTAHNLANASTTGYKKVRPEFEDLLSEKIRTPGPTQAQGGSSPVPLEVGLGVRTGATTRSMAQGDLVGTQNPLDVAIQGQGFFRILRPSGEFAYTRAGNFRVDGTGRLVTQQGELLDPQITVPNETTDLTIKPDGTIFAKLAGRDQPQELGTLELTMFTNPGGLSALGGNLLAATPGAGDPIQVRAGEQGSGSLTQGFLETANVKAVEEMIDMITTQRAYELNSKVIQTADAMLQKLTNLR